MADSRRVSQEHDLDTRARFIARNIAESLESSLEEIIKHQLATNSLDWEVLDPELHLEALLVGRRHEHEQSFSQKLQIAPLRLQGVTNFPATPNEGRNIALPYPSPACSTPRELRPRGRHEDEVLHTEGDFPDGDESRRPTGGLRLRGGESALDENSCRQLQSDARTFPKRRKINEERSAMKPSTLDKLVISIWEQLHGSLQLDPQVVTEQWHEQRLITGETDAVLAPTSHHFSRVNTLCRKVTQASRCCRSLEVIVQAHWVSCYDDRVRHLAEESPHLSITRHRMTVLKEACEDFGWTEKDLRNKMAVWRGYHEIEQAGGWVLLVFAGMGLYRYCKYRIDFTREALSKLNAMRPAFEVAADTLHPQWRQILSIVNEPTTIRYPGHPHDWVIGDEGAIPLRETYLQWDAEFTYEHLADSVINEDAWGDYDPRSRPQLLALHEHGDLKCEKCGEVQSDTPKDNHCSCFPNLYGGKQGPPPVQVFRTPVGKNNGLLALCVRSHFLGVKNKLIIPCRASPAVQQ
jgi:ATP-dependent RNA helicase DDX49/DBP8